MPLPFFLIAAAVAAGAAGVGTAIHGGVKMKEAKDTMEVAQYQNEKNQKHLEEQTAATNKDMDALGEAELKILNSFEEFANLIEVIQNKPRFIQYNKEGVKLPEYNPEELKQVSIGAGVLMGGLSGAALGTAGGFAAAGMTTAAVAALGVSSTGTAIASLSGAAAVNATLAALGGGAIAAGGGGMALGTTVLGASTLGVGLLIGGIIFSIAGSSVSKKADEAFDEMLRVEREINRICAYLVELSDTAQQYLKELQMVENAYQRYLNRLRLIVGRKQDWNAFTDLEKKTTENTVLLVGLLYQMCKVKLVLQSEDENELNQVNHQEIDTSISNANKLIADRQIA
ncbi:MAG: hypothetical protein ACI4XW_04230 [Candidatus Spyradocola sp.]